jgi:hypothetical protein
MAERCDIGALGLEFQRLFFERMIPPGGRDGLVVVRAVELLETQVAVGEVEGRLRLEVSRPHSRVRSVWLTAAQHDSLLSTLDLDQLLAIGAVIANDDLLDGESYRIKHVKNGIPQLALLDHPRDSESPQAVQAAADLDRFIRKAMSLCRWWHRML